MAPATSDASSSSATGTWCSRRLGSWPTRLSQVQGAGGAAGKGQRRWGVKVRLIQEEDKSRAGTCLPGPGAALGAFTYSVVYLVVGLGVLVASPQKVDYVPISHLAFYQPVPLVVQARRNGGRTRRNPARPSHLQPSTRATCAASTTRPWWQGSVCWGAPTLSQVTRPAAGGCARGRCACVPKAWLLGEGFSRPRCPMHPY